MKWNEMAELLPLITKGEYDFIGTEFRKKKKKSVFIVRNK